MAFQQQSWQNPLIDQPHTNPSKRESLSHLETAEILILHLNVMKRILILAS